MLILRHHLCTLTLRGFLLKSQHLRVQQRSGQRSTKHSERTRVGEQQGKSVGCTTRSSQVNVTSGNRSASAAPIRAVATVNCYSAISRSGGGTATIRTAGRPTGTSGTIIAHPMNGHGLQQTAYQPTRPSGDSQLEPFEVTGSALSSLQQFSQRSGIYAYLRRKSQVGTAW